MSASEPATRAPIDASHVALFAQSPFALWCELHAPPDARDPLDRFHEVLFEQGGQHEARVIAARYADAAALSYESEDEGFARTLDAMRAGAGAIRGAPLLDRDAGLRGRADVLARVEGGASIFGSYHYEIREIKLAKNIQDHHRLQAALYNALLGRAQGYTPSSFVIINRDGVDTRFAYDEAELEATLRAIRAIQAGHRPDPIYGGGVWPWESYTNRCASEARDVSMLAGVGPAMRDKLRAAGIFRIDDVAAHDEAALCSIQGIGPKTGAKLRLNAQAMQSGAHIRTGDVRFAPHTTEIFLDLEGTGAQTTNDGLVEMDYLIGVLVRRNGRETYHPFVAHTLDDEGAMFHAFLDWLRSQDDYGIYHWHHYEATHLRKLGERHGIDPPTRAKLFGALRDLYKDATNAIAFPTSRTSIKSVAPYMGFSWRHKDVNAMESIAHYLDYARDPAANKEKLQKVLDYNEDDCIAMRVVKDWLVAHAGAV